MHRPDGLSTTHATAASPAGDLISLRSGSERDGDVVSASWRGEGRRFVARERRCVIELYSILQKRIPYSYHKIPYLRISSGFEGFEEKGVRALLEKKLAERIASASLRRR
jgi:hypothetical protein